LAFTAATTVRRLTDSWLLTRSSNSFWRDVRAAKTNQAPAGHPMPIPIMANPANGTETNRDEPDRPVREIDSVVPSLTAASASSQCQRSL
jgi:hypothetical protein